MRTLGPLSKATVGTMIERRDGGVFLPDRASIWRYCVHETALGSPCRHERRSQVPRRVVIAPAWSFLPGNASASPPTVITTPTPERRCNARAWLELKLCRGADGKYQCRAEHSYNARFSLANRCRFNFDCWSPRLQRPSMRRVFAHQATWVYDIFFLPVPLGFDHMNQSSSEFIFARGTSLSSQRLT